jgi:hypothetical protein
VRKLIDASGRDIRLEIDGGIKVDNIRRVADAGADTFVAGSAIFGKPDYKAVIDAMRAELELRALTPRHPISHLNPRQPREPPTMPLSKRHADPVPDRGAPPLPQASGDLNALILDVSLACKAIARIVAFGELADGLGRSQRRGAARPTCRARCRSRWTCCPTRSSCAERVERPPGRHGLRGDGRAAQIPPPITRAASTCWCSTRWTAAATSTSTSRWAASSPSCVRRRR